MCDIFVTVPRFCNLVASAPHVQSHHSKGAGQKGGWGQGWRQGQNFKVPKVLRYLSADEKYTMVPTEIDEVKLLAPRTV